MLREQSSPRLAGPVQTLPEYKRGDMALTIADRRYTRLFSVQSGLFQSICSSLSALFSLHDLCLHHIAYSPS